MTTRKVKILTAIVMALPLGALAGCGSDSGPLVTPTPTPTAEMGRGAGKPCSNGRGECDQCYEYIRSNFNGTAIAAGDTVWFSAVGKVNGLPTNQLTTLKVTGSQVYYTDSNGNPVTAYGPDMNITFDPAATQATLSFNATLGQAGTFSETLPTSGLAGNFLLDGLALPLPAGLPGGGVVPTWTAQFQVSNPAVSLNWQWAAAAYTTFSTDYGALGVKPVDDNKASIYQNSDHAGTPENYRQYVVGGAAGGGGSNFTGSYSSTDSFQPCSL